MIKLKSEQDVYQALKTELGHEPREDIWEELVTDFYVGEAIHHTGDINGLLKRYKQQEKRYPISRKRVRQTYTEPPDERLMYSSKILAWDASQEQSVIDFRQEVLGGKLLFPDQVGPWIEDLAAREKGDGIRYITVKLPKGVKPELTPTEWLLKPPLVIEREKWLGQERDMLSYGVYSITDKKWVPSVIPVPEGGTLERLFNLSKYLRSKYSWGEAETTIFIMTGLIPPLLLAQSTPKWRRYAPITVTMELSLHLSPKKVAAIYGRVKKKVFSLYYPRHKRDRPMSKKHLELAVFYHQHRGKKGMEMMSLWNEEHEGYEYGTLTNFLRDAKHAHDRLVNL